MTLLGGAPTGTQQTFKSKNYAFSKKRHLRVVRNGVSTRSSGIYKWKMTAERGIDDGGTGVSIVWNNPKQSLRKHYVGSTWVQIRLYLHPNETLLWTQTDFTCTKRAFWALLYPPIDNYLSISFLLQPFNSCEFSWQYFSHRVKGVNGEVQIM